MIDLNPGMFVTPIITLTVIVSLCVFFLKRATDKSAFRRFVGWSAVLAFLLNLT